MKDNNSILVIGYEHNYPNTIKNTLKEVNFNCEVLPLHKNIELYKRGADQIEFQPIFEKIQNKVNERNYSKFVLDVPNLTLNTQYSNTVEVIEYLLGKGKLMILSGGDISKFERIFGKKYSSMIIERNFVIRYGSHSLIKNKILAIL